MQFFSHTLKEFEKISKIREGRCGIVYRFKEIDANDFYAAKVMKDDYSDNQIKKTVE